MKRIILLSALLLAASACATTTQAPSNTNASTPPTNTATSATPNTNAPALNSEITDKEKAIWESIKKKDAAGFAAMLADDFVYISSDGAYDKAGTVNGIKEMNVTELTLSDWKTVTLDKDAAVVTYTVNMKGTTGGKPIPPGSLRASSAWVNRGGKWVGVYHQDTEIGERPSSPPTSDKPSAKASPTADAKPAASNADDAVAREQQVWDAIRKRDYVAFANFLADDQIKVAAEGVNDKVGSVNGIQKVDLSGASLSNFKVVKLDSDAALVTYMVKVPANVSPNPERSSTIWVNRNGKWLAAFHQGTEVKPPAKK